MVRELVPGGFVYEVDRLFINVILGWHRETRFTSSLRDTSYLINTSTSVTVPNN